MEKYRLVREALSQSGGFEFVQAGFARREQIELAHDPGYVGRVLEGTLDPRALRRIGFPWSQGLVERTLASVGGTLAAAQDALDSGFGGNLAGGTHHASRSEGSGFCVFNDLAVSIRWLRSTGRVERAAVVDLDVHQGDGTAAIFLDDPEVFTFSMHARHNFPLVKTPSRLDVDLDDGVGDEEYLRILEESLPRVFEFDPGVVFFQTGVDGLSSDRLGRLSLTHDGLWQRDRMVMESCRTYGIPLVATLGGGYSTPIELSVEAHANTFRMAKRVFRGTAIALRA
jgi:acetoin utilization deacetylase AcuC-like enzyme